MNGKTGMISSITPIELDDLLSRMERLYNPRHIPPSEYFFNICRGVHFNYVAKAVNLIIENEDRFPTVAQFKKYLRLAVPEDLIMRDSRKSVGQLMAEYAAQNRCTAVLDAGNFNPDEGEIRPARLCGASLDDPEYYEPEIAWLCKGHHRENQDKRHKEREGLFDNAHDNTNHEDENQIGQIMETLCENIKPKHKETELLTHAAADDWAEF